MSSSTTSHSALLMAACALVSMLLLGSAADAGLFQHLNASVAVSVIDDGGDLGEEEFRQWDTACHGDSVPLESGKKGNMP